MATEQSTLLRPSSQHSSPPETTQKEEKRQCINIHSKSSKVIAVYWTFLIMGAGDAAYGVSLRQLNWIISYIQADEN